MFYRRVPVQIPWPTPHFPEANCSTTTWTRGPACWAVAALEGSDTTEEQQTPSYPICPHGDPHPFHVGSRITTKNAHGNDQGLPQFLWSGKEEAGGGACAVAWDVVCRPKWAGGLGVLDMRWMNVALQTKWIWLQKTDTSRPWAEFNIPVPKESRQLSMRHRVYNSAMARARYSGRTSGSRISNPRSCAALV